MIKLRWTVYFTQRPAIFISSSSIQWPGYLIRYSDSVRAGRSGDLIPVGARFSAPVQTGPGVHPPSYPMGTGFFPWLKRPGRYVDHPLPSSAEVKERVELYLYPPSGTSWPVPGLPLPLPYRPKWTPPPLHPSYQISIGNFCLRGVNWPYREGDHSPPSSAKVNNVCSFIQPCF